MGLRVSQSILDSLVFKDKRNGNTLKGVVVVFYMLVDLFKGHIRTQWGRLPQ